MTIRLYNQFEFFKACLKKNLFLKISGKNNLYLLKKNQKFNTKFSTLNKFNNRFINSNYFYVWLSGFMEIKSSFLVNIKRNNSYSYFFSIEHNNDYYILYTLHKLYNVSVKIKNIKNISYVLRTSNKNNLNSIINHCISYPLLGEKSKLLDEFLKIFLYK